MESAASAPHAEDGSAVYPGTCRGRFTTIEDAVAFAGRLVALGKLAQEMFDAMSFAFLFDPKRELLSIGYRVADESLDPSYYDLLASEAAGTEVAHAPVQ